jgi:hypothetical protein
LIQAAVHGGVASAVEIMIPATNENTKMPTSKMADNLRMPISTPSMDRIEKRMVDSGLAGSMAKSLFESPGVE